MNVKNKSERSCNQRSIQVVWWKEKYEEIKKIKCYETIQIQEYLNTDKLDAEELTQNVIGE